jgi:hypothetical protein
MSISCRLFRNVNESGWIELLREISVDVFSSGIVIRELSSGSLLADFPHTQIKEIDVLSKLLVRIVIHDGTERTGLKFSNDLECESFCRMLQRYNILVTNVTEERESNQLKKFIPDVNNSDTQEFLLNLIFSDEFKTFVNNLGVLFGQFDNSIEKC